MDSSLGNPASASGYLHSSNSTWLHHAHPSLVHSSPPGNAAHYYAAANASNAAPVTGASGGMRKPYSLLPYSSSSSSAMASSAAAPSSLTRRGMLFAGDPASYRAKTNQALASSATSASASPTSSSSAASSPFPYAQPAAQSYFPGSEFYYPPSSYLAAYPSPYYDMTAYANSAAAAAGTSHPAYLPTAGSAARGAVMNPSMYGASNVYGAMDPSTGLPIMNLNMNAMQIQSMQQMNMAASAAAAAAMPANMQTAGIPVNNSSGTTTQYSGSKKKGKRAHELMVNPSTGDMSGGATGYYPGVTGNYSANGHELHESEEDASMQMQMQYMGNQGAHNGDRASMNLSPQSSISSSTSTTMPIASSTIHSVDEECESEKSARIKAVTVDAASLVPAAAPTFSSSSSSFSSAAASTSEASASLSTSAFSSVSASGSPLSSLFSSQFFASYKSMFYTFDQSFFVAAIDFARLSFELALIIQEQEAEEEDDKNGMKDEKSDSAEKEKDKEKDAEREKKEKEEAKEKDSDKEKDKVDSDENKAKRLKTDPAPPQKSKVLLERFHQWKESALAEFRKPFIYLERKTADLSTLLAKSSADSTGHGRVYQQLDNLRSFSLWSVLFVVKFIKRIRPKLRAFEDVQETILPAILDLEGSAWKSIHAPCMQNESTLLHLMQNAALKQQQQHSAKKDKGEDKDKKKSAAKGEDDSDDSDDEDGDGPAGDVDSVKSEDGEDLDAADRGYIQIDHCALCRGSLTYFSFPVTLCCSHDFHYLCLVRHWGLFHSAMSPAAPDSSSTEHFRCPLGSCRKEAIIERQDVVYDERRWHAKLATVQAMANAKPSKVLNAAVGGVEDGDDEDDEESLNKKHNMHMTDAMTLATITDGHSHSKKSHGDSTPSSNSNTPAPRGGSSRRGMALVKVSCHQCKTTKDNASLLFCTAKAEKGKRKRKCRKKYCDACLRRSYQMSVTQFTPEEVKKFICPSCEGRCTCAACQRKSLNVKDNEEVHVTLAAAAAGGHQSASKLSAAPMLAWDPTIGRYVTTSMPLSSAPTAPAGWGMGHAHAVPQQYLHSAFLPLHHPSMMSAAQMSYGKPKLEGKDTDQAEMVKDSITASPSSSRAARGPSPTTKND